MTTIPTPQLDGHVGPDHVRTTYRILTPEDLRSRFGVEDVIFVATSEETGNGGVEWFAQQEDVRHNLFSMLRADEVPPPGELERWAVDMVRRFHEDKARPMRKARKDLIR